jgi:very-long-chain enoyl-CoA reductase
VFFFEYFGPMVIYPLFFFFPNIIYPWAKAVPEKTMVQKVACAYWVGHYAKRIAETYLVHVFGHDTMPIFNLFKNCSYYYGFAAYVAYFTNHPAYTSPAEAPSMVLFAIATLFQFSNLRWAGAGLQGDRVARGSGAPPCWPLCWVAGPGPFTLPLLFNPNRNHPPTPRTPPGAT